MNLRTGCFPAKKAINMADAPRNTTSMNTTISEVRSIAEAAINSINQLTNLIEGRSSTSTPTSTPRTSHTPLLSTPRSTTQSLLLNQITAVNVQSRQSSALTELRRRFPTVSRARECSGRYVSANRSSNPYSTTTPRRRVGGSY